MTTMVVAQSAMLWQPNKAVVVTVSVLVAGVVSAALVFMFAGHTEPAARIMPVELSLTSAAPSLQTASTRLTIHEHQIKPQTVLKPVPISKIENIPVHTIAPISPPIDWQQQIQMSVENQSQNSVNPNGFILNKPSQTTPLQQALNAPRKPETMQDGGSYRSIYGGVMLKSGGMCSEVQTIQVGPSPSNRVNVVFPGNHCAGDYQPSMADELSRWADKEAQKHQPPF
jgi:hypothetical protein